MPQPKTSPRARADTTIPSLVPAGGMAGIEPVNAPPEEDVAVPATAAKAAS
jgi:hypothetical protein